MSIVTTSMQFSDLPNDSNFMFEGVPGERMCKQGQMAMRYSSETGAFLGKTQMSGDESVLLIEEEG